METTQSVKIQGLQKDVDDTVVIMKDNIEKAIERGENLDELEERSEMLVEESHAFEQTAKKIKKKYWWKNKKWQMIIIGVAVGVVLIIILAIVLSIKPWQN